MADLFISYARKDNQDHFVSNLVAALEQEGLTVWIDRNEIPLGADWWQEVCEGIEGADTFTTIITPNLVNSEISGNELNHALDKNKRLMPILAIDLSKEDHKRLPEKLGQINWTYIRTTDNLAQAVKPFIQAVRTDLDYVRAHTRLLVRAEEWDDQKKNNSFLLRGNDLQSAENWLAKSSTAEPKPTELQTQYIFASRRASNRFQRNLLVGVSAALVVTIVLAFISFLLFRLAERRADEAQSLGLAASAQQALLAGNTDLALALAIEANAINDSPSRAQDALSAAALAPGTRWLLTGHDDPVTAIAYSPDGKQALSGGWDGRLIAWDLTTGKEQFRYDFPKRNFVLVGSRSLTFPQIIYSIDYSPDGQTALLGTIEDTILWNLKTNREIKRFSTNGLSIASVKFSHDGALALTALNDYTLVLWEIASGQQIRTFRGHTDDVTSGVFSPDGQMIASASRDNNIILWDVNSGESLKTFTGHTGKVNEVAFSPDGQMLASVSSDGLLMLWNVQTGEQTRLSRDTVGALNALAFSPDGKTVVTGGSDQMLTFWRVETKEVIQRLYGHKSMILRLVYSPDGRMILSGSDDTTVRLWYANTPAQRQAVVAHDDAVRGLAVSGDGRLILSSSADRTIKLWEAATGKLIRTFTGHTDTASRVAFSPDQTTMLSTSRDGTFRLWDIQTGKELKQHDLGEGQRGFGVTYSPDGQTALIILLNLEEERSNLIYWDVKNWKEIRRYPAKPGLYYTGAAFMASGDMALLGNADSTIDAEDATFSGEFGYISLLNLNTAQVATPVGMQSMWHRKGVYAMALSHDERYAVSGASDNSIGLWDIKTGTLLKRFNGHRNVIRGLAFSPDDRTVLSGADDNTIMLWDVRTGGQIVRYEGHSSYVNGVAFLPNDGLAISIAEDKTLRYWQLPLPAKEMMAWSFVNRYVPQLTCEERVQYLAGVSCSPTAVPTDSPTATPIADKPQTTPTIYDRETVLAAIGQLPFDVLIPEDIPGMSISDVSSGDISSVNTTPLGETVDHLVVMSLTLDDAEYIIFQHPTQHGTTVREWVSKQFKVDSNFEQEGFLSYKQIKGTEVVMITYKSINFYVFLYNQTMVAVYGLAGDQSKAESIIEALIPPNGTVVPASSLATGQP